MGTLPAAAAVQTVEVTTATVYDGSPGDRGSPRPLGTAAEFPAGCVGSANPTGEPVGGGAGYSRALSKANATVVVSDLAGLQSALSSASAGDVIYVNDSATINLTGQSNLQIPGGVTLASGRGVNGSQGALLQTTSYPNPLFRTGGPGVRIAGLRVQGPFSDIGDANTTNSRGIVSNRDALELDNSELWGWTYTAVYLDKNATNSIVHHNHFHHNRKTGLGYGVMIAYSDSASPIDALIEGNLFDHNRHSVAATGNPYSSYEARYNLVLENDTSQSLDRHGTANPGTWRGGWAGDWTIIHNNTVTRTSGVSVAIRGEPVYGARVDHNHFFTASESTAIRLYNYSGVQVSSAPKVDLRENLYGTGNPLTLKIASPADGSNTTEVQVEIAGFTNWTYGAGLCRVDVKVGSGPWVVARGVLAAGWNFSWNATVPLALGMNDITVRATSVAGQVVTATTTVERVPVVPYDPSITVAVVVTILTVGMVLRRRRLDGN